MFTGAVSVWNPFGGGATMTSGGFSFGGGGSSFLTSTKSTFCSIFSFFWPAFSVALIARKITSTWKIALTTMPPGDFCFLALDSSRLLNNVRTPSYWWTRTARGCDGKEPIVPYTPSIGIFIKIRLMKS